MEAGIPNRPKQSGKSESGMKTLPDVHGSPRFASSVAFLREPRAGVHHPHHGVSPGEGNPGVEGAGGRRWWEEARVQAVHQAQRATSPGGSQAEARGDSSPRR